jgi:hypothetical protein
MFIYNDSCQKTILVHDNYDIREKCNFCYFTTHKQKKRETFILYSSVAEPEPPLLVGAGAVMRCGSGSDNGITHG